MRILSRTTIIEEYSTFLTLVEQSNYLTTRWISQPNLKRNIEKIVSKSQKDREVLSIEFLQKLKDDVNRIYHWHLSAYLQETSFWATQKSYIRLRNIISNLSWADYFSFAQELVATPSKLLKNYQPNLGAQIKTYAQRKLEDRIADYAYRLVNWNRASDWGLLRKLTLRSCQEALKRVLGLSGNKLEIHLLVWQCFKDNYTPIKAKNSRQLSPPNQQQFQQMVAQFNHLIAEINPSLTKIDRPTLESILNNCIEAARKYSNPQSIPTPENFEIVSSENNLLINLEEKEEKKQTLNRVETVLANTFEQLKIPQQIMLKLWLGLGLTQTEIVKIMQPVYPDFVTKQYQVARQIDKCRLLLINALLKQELPDGKKLTSQEISQLKTPFDEWLKKYCQSIFSSLLEKIYVELERESQDEFQSQFQDEIQEKIQSELEKIIASNLQLELPKLPSIEAAINLLIEQYKSEKFKTENYKL